MQRIIGINNEYVLVKRSVQKYFTLHNLTLTYKLIGLCILGTIAIRIRYILVVRVGRAYLSFKVHRYVENKMKKKNNSNSAYGITQVDIPLRVLQSVFLALDSFLFLFYFSLLQFEVGVTRGRKYFAVFLQILHNTDLHYTVDCRSTIIPMYRGIQLSYILYIDIQRKEEKSVLRIDHIGLSLNTFTCHYLFARTAELYLLRYFSLYVYKDITVSISGYHQIPR